MNQIGAILANTVYDQFEKKRFGINSCRPDHDPTQLERLFDLMQHFEVNKALDKSLVVYFGETKTKYDLEQEIENSYCPKAVELINTL